MINDRQRIKDARRRAPRVMAAIEALQLDRLVYLEARATSIAFRLRADIARGMPPQKTLPAHAAAAARIMEAVIRRRRTAERRAAERAAAAATANDTETPIAA